MQKVIVDGGSETMLTEFGVQLKRLTAQQDQLEHSLTQHFEALKAKIDALTCSCMCGALEPLSPPGVSSPTFQSQTSQPSRGLLNVTTFKSFGPRLPLDELQVVHEPEAPNIRTERLRRFVQSISFEAIMGVVIVTNMACMGLRMQFTGMNMGASLGFGGEDSKHMHWIITLRRLEVVFVCVYWIEMLLRAWAMRRKFCKSAVMLYEMCAILLSTLDIVADSASLDLGLPSIGPILRVTRALRLAKILRILAAFPELNVFLITIKNSFAPLGWGLVLLFVIMGATSIVASELLLGFIEDESKELLTRSWAFEHFGTTGRSMLTMLESTFSPKWTTILRTFATEVSFLAAVLWSVYGIVVNFAAIRLVASLFVKGAMSADRNEHQRASLAKSAEIQRNASNICRLFKAMDSSGDGKIQRAEIVHFMQEENDDTRDFFASVDLTKEEALAVFDLACSESGEVDVENFISMAISIRNPVQNIDTMRILHETNAMKQHVVDIEATVGAILRNVRHWGRAKL